MCGWALKASLATLPARSIIRAKPAVVDGEPRSDVNTNGDFGAFLPRQTVDPHRFQCYLDHTATAAEPFWIGHLFLPLGITV